MMNATNAGEVPRSANDPAVMPRGKNIAVRLLRPEAITAAHALVEVTCPDIPAARWCAFARRQICGHDEDPPSCGILSAETGGGHIRGLAAFNRAWDEPDCLCLRLFILPPYGRRTVAELLFQAAYALADRHDCSRMCVHLPSGSAWESAFLRDPRIARRILDSETIR